MSFRFQKFSGVYPRFSQQFLNDNPDYESLSYQELYDRFIDTWYGLSNFYARHLVALGNEAQDLFASAEFLQKVWARENGVRYGEESWLQDIVLAQIALFQPDVLYLQDLYLFDSTFRKQIRETYGKPVIIVGWIAAPIQDFNLFKDLDIVLTSHPGFVKDLSQAGANAFLMRLAFEPSVLDVVKAETRDLDFTFGGMLGHRNGIHSERYALIEQLMEKTLLEFWGDVVDPLMRPGKERALDRISYRANKLLHRAGVSANSRQRLPLLRRATEWTSDPSRPSITQLFPERCHEAAFGLKNYQLLSRSKVVFNSHIDCSDNYAGNLRLYEATGMGACLLTDWKENLSDMFEPEAEVVTYRSPEECAEKVKYLLEHEEERKRIAEAGQRRTLRDHTFFIRTQALVDILDSHLKGAQASSGKRETVPAYSFASKCN